MRVVVWVRWSVVRRVGALCGDGDGVGVGSNEFVMNFDVL